MASQTGAQVVDLNRLRRSCRDCSLRDLCLPAGIGRADMEELDSVVRSRLPLDRGDSLYRPGDAFEHVFVVRSGSIRTSQATSDGEEQILGFHLPGEILGLDAISEAIHLCQASALERTSVCAVPFTRLESVAGHIPGLQHQLMRIISREMVREHEHLVALGRRSARERLATFLCSVSDRMRRAGYAADRISLPMPRADIANYLGLALETVSRLLTRLAADGVIRVQRREVEILDPGRLLALAGRSRGEHDRGRDHGA